MGHLDAVGPTRTDPRLDRGADVVDMDVHVPEPVAAHHEQRVAQRLQGHLEKVGRRVVGLQEVHHLVRRAVLGSLRLRGRARLGQRSTWWLAHRVLAGDRSNQRVQQDGEATAARVDDARAAQGLELVGRTVQRIVGTGSSRADHLGQPRADPTGLGSRAGGGRTGHRQDRPLHRVGNRGVRGIGGPLERHRHGLHG